MCTPGPSKSSLPGPSPSKHRPISRLDQNIYRWCQKSLLTALKKRQQEEAKELYLRIEEENKELESMSEEDRQEKIRQMNKEFRTLQNVHLYQNQHPDVAPEVINSIYLDFLKIPMDDRPPFEEYLSFKQQLRSLGDQLFQLPVDQFNEVIDKNGGNLGLVFLNADNNPLGVLDEGRVEQEEGDEEKAEEEVEQFSEEEEIEEEQDNYQNEWGDEGGEGEGMEEEYDQEQFEEHEEQEYHNQEQFEEQYNGYGEYAEVWDQQGGQLQKEQIDATPQRVEENVQAPQRDLREQMPLLRRLLEDQK